MQNIFCCNGFFANTAFGKGQIFGNATVQMVAHHQHVQMLVKRINREGTGWIG